MPIYPQTFQSRKVKTNALNYSLMIFTKGLDVVVLLAIGSATFSSYGCFLAVLLCCICVQHWRVTALLACSGSSHRLLLVKLPFISKRVITQSHGWNSTASMLININRTLNPNSIYLKASLEMGGGGCRP